MIRLGIQQVQRAFSDKGSQIDLCIALPYREPVHLGTGSTIQNPINNHKYAL